MEEKIKRRKANTRILDISNNPALSAGFFYDIIFATPHTLNLIFAKMKKTFTFILFSIACVLFFAANVQAQCAMCTINAEQGVKNGNTQAAGLNTGVIYLLVIPYLLATVVGIIWYKKYRKKNVQLNMKSEPLNLN
ncbi:hypothetical protein QWY86_02145 [Pedobacter aquatilis]|uniref:hypothetical protein n=1 Tax=Pedobacter aquatilis TaxID=351343 RepID=UPI0025B3FD74|nr:hypothetical protein [Pedobacter aquatilis]MDN3585451.1 hypothetical protein [Pedobacter aquatilis]